MIHVARKAIHPDFNPASLNLGGWWRGSYSASPWAANASAGASGSYALSEATNPPTAASYANGYTVPDFDGTNDILTGTALSNLMTTTAYSVVVLFQEDGHTVDNKPNTAGAMELFSATSGGICFGTYTSTNSLGGVEWGLSFHHNDGSWKTANLTGAGRHPEGGTVHKMLIARFSSATGQIRFRMHVGLQYSLLGWSSSTVEQTLTGVGAVGSLAGTLRVGASVAASARFFSGEIRELMFSPTVFSDQDCDGIRRYVNKRYGISLSSV